MQTPIVLQPRPREFEWFQENVQEFFLEATVRRQRRSSVCYCSPYQPIGFPSTSDTMHSDIVHRYQRFSEL